MDAKPPRVPVPTSAWFRVRHFLCNARGAADGSLVQRPPSPRFNDLFVVGIALTVYLYTWESAAYLLLIATTVSAWVLPPYGSLRVAGFNDRYRLVSFTCLSVFLICLLSRMKTRLESRRTESPATPPTREPR